MKLSTSLLLLAAVVSLPVSCFGGSAGALRPSELLAAPDKYLGKTVELEIVEPLYGPSTEAALKASEYGGMEVMIPDGGGPTLKLVPSAFKPEDPNRFKNKFDRVMRPPARVKGEFLKDAEMTESLHRPYYLIRVVSWEPMALEAPVTVKSLAEIKADPAKWDRKPVVYEGMYENRFEVSAVDKDIWLDFQANAQVLNRPADSSKPQRIRVTGVLFSKPGARYGHLGGYSFEILASQVEFLN